MHHITGIIHKLIFTIHLRNIGITIEASNTVNVISIHVFLKNIQNKSSIRVGTVVNDIIWKTVDVEIFEIELPNKYSLKIFSISLLTVCVRKKFTFHYTIII